MSWLKLDDGMGEHRKITRTMKASRAAVALHFLGLLHCSRYLTDGFIEEEFVDDLCDMARIRPAERRQAIDALVKYGLWVPTDGGWTAHDYLDHNPSREAVLASRKADAERKRRGRESKKRPQGVRADADRTDAGRQSESARPVPSRPTTTPPNPPASGGDLGTLFPGGSLSAPRRRRHREGVQGDREAWALEHFPGALPRAVADTASFAAGHGWNPDTGPEGLREWAQRAGGVWADNLEPRSEAAA